MTLLWGCNTRNSVIVTGATPPVNPLIGDSWVDTGGPVPSLKIYDGNTWIESSNGMYIGDAEPLTPGENFVWFDTSETPPPIKVWLNDSWGVVGGTGGGDIAGIDGGSANSVYLLSQVVDGGSAGSAYLTSQTIDGGAANG